MLSLMLGIVFAPLANASFPQPLVWQIDGVSGPTKSEACIARTPNRPGLTFLCVGQSNSDSCGGDETVCVYCHPDYSWCEPGPGRNTRSGLRQVAKCPANSIGIRGSPARCQCNSGYSQRMSTG